MSKKFFRSPERNKNLRALVLIQGMGAVRAGVWGRSVCINDNFELGSMIPQVDWALRKKISVIIMNPNENFCWKESIPFNESMESHAKFVWRNYI